MVKRLTLAVMILLMSVTASLAIELHDAARNGDTKIVMRLLNEGADVNARNFIGWTPLHFAAWNGHTAAVQLLLAAGADVNAEDKYGDTPLDYAQQQNHGEWITTLLK